MAVIDLGGQAQQRRMQQLMMYSEFMRKSPLGTGESALDIELERQSKEREAEKEAARRERATQAQIEEGQQRIEIQRKGAEELSGRAERKLAEEIPKLRAETGAAGALEREREATRVLRGEQAKEAQARTGVAEQEEAAKKDWRVKYQEDALDQHARNIWNFGIGEAARGNKDFLTKENADRLEVAGKRLFGPTYKVERDANGAWAPDPKKIAASTLDEHGMPSAKFAADLAKAEQPKTNFEAYVRAAQQARAEGNTEAERWYTEKVHEEVALTEGKVRGEALKGMSVDDMSTTLARWHGKNETGGYTGGGKAGQALQQDIRDGVDILGTLRGSYIQFEDLQKKGKLLTRSGYANMKWQDFRNLAGMGDPELEVWRANVMDSVARYRKFITGKASNEREMQDLLKAVPSEDDTVASFLPKLQQSIDKVTRRIRTDLGAADAFGIKMEEGLGEAFPIITPKEAVNEWGTPDMTLAGGRQAKAAYKHVMGVERLGAAAQRTGVQIGGVGEFRGAPEQKQVQVLVEDLVTKPKEEMAAQLKQLQQTNPELVRRALDQLREGVSAE